MLLYHTGNQARTLESTTNVTYMKQPLHINALAELETLLRAPEGASTLQKMNIITRLLRECVHKLPPRTGETRHYGSI
jgi:hypothetical protein